MKKTMTIKMMMAAMMMMAVATNVMAGDVTFKISNMNCGGCANKVKTALNKTEAVSNVDIDLQNKIAKVTFDDAKTDAKKLQEVLKEARFNAEVTTEQVAANTSNATSATKPSTDAPVEVPVYNSNTSFKVSNMHCGGCARRVKNTLNETHAVGQIDIDLQTKEVKVNYDETKVSPKDLQQALANAKFQVEILN